MNSCLVRENLIARVILFENPVSIIKTEYIVTLTYFFLLNLRIVRYMKNEQTDLNNDCVSYVYIYLL